VETSGLDWKQHRPVGYVVTWGPGAHETRYFPTDHTGGGNLPKHEILAYLTDLLGRPDLAVIGHNLKFDLHFAANDLLSICGPVEDTQCNAALIDENVNAYSLDAVATRCGVQAKKGAELYAELATQFGGRVDKSQMANFHLLPGNHPLVVEYAEGDGTTTWQVRDVQQTILDNENLHAVWEVESSVLPVLFRMERRGVRVHEERLAWLKQWLTEQVQEAEKALPQGFNPRATSQIREYLQTRGVTTFMKTQPTERFPDGTDSFMAPWLETIPEAKPILVLRRFSGLLSKFVDPMLEKHLFNGRVHCEFNQLRADEFGTVTGRLSSSRPNMQQIPKRNKELAPLFRQIFLPEKGHQWSLNDYSQQEFRVFADYTGSQVLLDGYKAIPPLDIHSVVADLLHVERDPAKTMNFGILYGMGVAKLARSLGIPEQEAAQLRAKYDTMLPEVKRFTHQAERTAASRGWVRTKLHRRRRFPDRLYAYKAGNAVIQGSSADMTKVKMVEIDRYFRQAKCESALMLQVHDELDWTLGPDDAPLDMGARAIMESFDEKDKIQFDVPMKVDQSVADDWGRASFPGWEGPDGQ
jgi:DNA polymerase I-like protein with 3'-5' exonuclease and polymerase domains